MAGPLLLAALVAGAGCATSPAPAWGVPERLPDDPVERAEVMIARAAPKDRQLYRYRLAQAALLAGDWEVARRTLDGALPLTGAVLTEDAGARRARSTFGAEADKTFIGEPYERVMAYYYRAIVYWLDGELDNARACYRAGQILDTDPENQQLASDYVLLDWLDGYVTQRLGGDGSAELRRAEGHAARTQLALPPPRPAAGLVVFAEYGRGPLKAAEGEHGEKLRFRERPSRAVAARLRVGDGAPAVPLAPWDDLLWQAQTRGGRVMDHILAGKAVFKDTASTVGDLGLLAGAVVVAGSGDGDEGQRNLGYGLMAAGLLAKLVASAATPAADTRAWDGLPRYLSFAHLDLPPGPREVTVEFLDTAGRAIPEATRTVTVTVPEPGRGSAPAVVFASFNQ